MLGRIQALQTTLYLLEKEAKLKDSSHKTRCVLNGRDAIDTASF